MSHYVPLSEEVPGAGRRYRLYSAADGFRIRFTAANETRRRLRVQPLTLQAAYQFRLSDSDGDVPLHAEWEDVYRNASGKPSRPVDLAEVELAPRESVGWDVVLTRADRRFFGNGVYVVRYTTVGALRSVSFPAGDAIELHQLDGQFSITFDVQSPRSSDEWVRYHLLRGRYAREREEYLDALEAFTAADRVDPTRLPGRSGVASIYMRQGRYDEAIAIYEDMLRRRSLDESGDNLAFAYVAVGRIDDARETLRRLGRNDQELGPAIRRLEQRVDEVRRER
jgi:pentatricopeptide repeat protein